MKKIFRKNTVIPFVLIFTIMISLTCSGSYYSFLVKGSEASDLKDQLNNITSQQEQYKEKIEESKKDIEAKESEKENLDKYLNSTKQKIDIYSDMINDLSEDLSKLEKELDSSKEDLDKQMEVYKKRLRSSYMEGGVSFLEVLFDSGSVSEFLISYDSQKRIAANDKKIVENLEIAQEKLSASIASIENKKKQQITLKANLQNEQKNYETEISRAENAISNLEGDVEAYTRSLKKIEQDEERIRNEIKNLTNKDSSYVGGEFSWPLPGYTRISSPFGMRWHPVVGGYRLHNGIDLPAPRGTKIVAANDGVVIKKQHSNSWGNHVVIDHGGGKVTLYAHASGFADIQVGQEVKRGQTIAYVGTTGWSTGNHLHFSVIINGEYVNPMSYLK